MREGILKAVFGAAAAVAFTVTVAPAPNAVAITSIEAIEQTIAEQTNAYRQREGLKPLLRDEHLQKAANAYAHFMARTGQYGHKVDGQTPALRVSQVGYDHCIVRENIAFVEFPGNATAKEIAVRLLSGWIRSTGHRKNLKARYVTGLGIGVARSNAKGLPRGVRRYYAVQVFAKPIADAFRFAVRNTRGQPVDYTVDGKSFTLPPNTLHKHLQCSPPLIKTTVLGKQRTYKPKSGETIDL